MLSFPAPRWRTALNTVAKSNEKRPPGSRFGRVASPVTPRVYLSDYFTASDADELVRLGITHVISVLEHDTHIPECIPKKQKLHLRLADNMDVNILEHLDDTTNFITSALAEDENNKVLVHCFQGISRSATIVCAYLIASSGMTAIEAITHTQAKRGIVCPNIGFRRQLETYSHRFVSKRLKQRGGKVAKISGDIAERIRRLQAGPRLSS
ncbi:protein-tyrosine phosphatase-like protein [Collybia nuda]|uniref:Protein-tyrosine phosphatase-like protein n=1 Tax=Collybia nuda TaxID=64659 RepID=A0A9P6CJL3_9AGAR|nr:protein-tyrosine phosphatase-like protein [Collybia nuda]